VARTVRAPGVPQLVNLQQAIDIAAAKSPLLAQARANETIANANVKLARAPALPSVGVVGSSTHSNTSGGASLGGSTGGGAFGNNGSTGGRSGSGGSFTSNSLDANLKQLIFDGGRVSAQIRAASENEQGTADTYRRQLQTVAFNVANAYYNALAAGRTVAIDAELVRENQVSADLVAAQVRAGTEARAQIATAELPVAQARVNLVRAQGAEYSALATFVNALGLDANVDVRPVDDTPSNPSATLLQPELLSYDAAMARAALLRPDLAAAQRTINAAEETLHAARLGKVPTVNGSAGLGVASTLPDGSNFNHSGNIGATITIPIFDQGLTAAQTEQAQGQLENARANFENTRLGVGLNVRQALTNLVSAQAALVQTQAELRNARQVLQSTQAQYRAGVTTLPLLLNAEVGLTQAETDNVNAIYALRQAEQNYLFALGENDTQIPAGYK